MWFRKIFAKKPKINTDLSKINNLLTRGVEDIFVKDSLEAKLRSGKELRIKLGFDPTGSKIHIGRAIVLRKLKAFQDLGHKVIFIAGDFTAQIGDPSDKLEKRPMLTKEKIQENLKTYKEQVGKIIDLSHAEFHFNSSWLGRLTFNEICNLAESFSVNQMLARRNFKDRFDKGEEISLREFMYPLMQGYDSVAIKSDVEIGGFDQLFNLKAGRVVQKYYKQREQDVLTTKMLPGTDGRKMSTSWGNVINITDFPNEMYGKVMSLKDDLIPLYFLLTTNVSEDYVKEIEEKLKNNLARELKMELAREIVTLYHSKDKAFKAENYFVSVFSEKGIPNEVREEKINKGTLLRDAIVDLKIVSSKSEYTRLVEQGAIFNMTENKKIEDTYEKTESTAVYRIGKKQFIKIIVN